MRQQLVVALANTLRMDKEAGSKQYIKGIDNDKPLNDMTDDEILQIMDYMDSRFQMEDFEKSMQNEEFDKNDKPIIVKTFSKLKNIVEKLK